MLFFQNDLNPFASGSDTNIPIENVSTLKNLSIDELLNKLITNMVDFAIHLCVAILVFYVGKLLIRKLFSFTAKVLTRREVDRSLSTFILSLIRIVLYFILVVTVIGILGINTSSFIALFASAGVAIGMALSGTLQNFAGGVLILLLKPYKVGDYIEAQGFSGTVTEIQIFSTIICTADNKTIIIPNGGLSTGSINNWSRGEYRRVEWPVSISYGNDVETARKVIIDMLMDDDRIVKTTLNADREHRKELAMEEKAAQEPEPPKRRGFLYRMFHSRREKAIRHSKELEASAAKALSAIIPDSCRRPTVVLAQMADSSIQLSARAWVRSTDYWDVFYEYNEKIYNTLPRHGISFPFPQIDVHLSREPSEDTVKDNNR